jgi:hypothetical protein
MAFGSTHCRQSLFVGLTVVGLSLAVAGSADASIVTNPASFTATMTIINYTNSPVGVLPGGTSITNQYAAIGVLHDGSTTVSGPADGPPGISSPSGLTALESPVGDADPNLPISVTFTTPVTEFGAYFLMGSRTDSILLEARRADNTIIETQTILPAGMTLGPFGFNEGFIGMILSEPVALARFVPLTSAFVIDDLHFGVTTGGVDAVPEPATLVVWSMIGASGVGLCVWRRAKR